MSKPLAAKGVGACSFRHVLITRFRRSASNRRRTHATVGVGDGSGGAAWPPGPGVTGKPAARGVADDTVPPAAAPAVPDVTALYRAEGPRLLRFFRRWTANSEDARDLMQESFSRLLGAGTAPGLQRPEAYLKRIGHNLLRDRARFAVRRSELLHVPAGDEDLAGADQFRLLETRDLLDRLDRVMLELPQETREVFMSHRLDGLTYGEIAERTGLTVKQVEKRLAKAAAQISRAMDPD